MKKSLLYILLALALSCCHRNSNQIIPVDYNQYFEGNDTMTEEQRQTFSRQFISDTYNNTVGKRIPNVKIRDVNGNSTRTDKLIKGGTIIVFSALDSEHGLEDLARNFPTALRHLEENADDIKGLEGIKDIDVVCLIGQSDNGAVDSDIMRKLANEYSKIYFIHSEDASKLNLLTSPTKLFVKKDKTVAHIAMGYLFDLEDEGKTIWEGVYLMRKELL